MRISEKLEAAAVDVNLRGGTVEEAIAELALLVSRSSDGRDADQLRERLMARERMLSTAMGAGIAFPHCISPQLSTPKFALGISHRGIDADAPDNKPVHIFFVVISPESDPEAHLESLAAASRVFSNPSVREKILAATRAEDAIMALADAEED